MESKLGSCPEMTDLMNLVQIKATRSDIETERKGVS